MTEGVCIAEGMQGGGCMAEGHAWLGLCMSGGVMHGRGVWVARGHA